MRLLLTLRALGGESGGEGAGGPVATCLAATTLGPCELALERRARLDDAELMHTLDHEKGGEIAANLERLYRFMLDHLVEANLEKDPRRLGRVRAMLGTIAGAYQEILRGGGLQKLDAA